MGIAVRLWFDQVVGGSDTCRREGLALAERYAPMKVFSDGDKACITAKDPPVSESSWKGKNIREPV